MPDERNLVLDYIKRAPEFEDKAQKLSHILYNLKTWDNEFAKELFIKYLDYIYTKDNFIYYKILEDAAKNNFDWALKIYENHVHKKLSLVDKNPKKEFSFTHEDKQLMEIFFLYNHEKSFDFYLKIIEEIIEKTRLPIRKENECKFYFRLCLFVFKL